MAETKMEKLIKKRAGIKAKLTIFSNFINNILPSKELSSVQLLDLEGRFSKFDTLYTVFDQLQCDIEMLSDNLENECQEREYFENQYHELIAKARGLLGEQPSHRRELQDGSVASFEDVKAGGSKFNCVRLPKISIPTFHGHYQHWLEYRDTFISLIHSRSDIDDINKLHYLRASLKDSALLVIDSLDVKGDNYANAWKLLCSRYDNKRLLVNNHVQALFNVEQIQKESSQSIRHLIDITNKNLRALSTLDQPTQYKK
ncbi:uncharacterized protein LOC123667726 [Melitaea cinxia]|uniref:uncharacterized protein LOC123667726 n=1 Tax=Melitaea cinxia TaxID=113334 RepID=UPI001E2743D4|nr:uncharacterized protein LOC123667726 [Melitaea cinxia]